MTGQKLIAFLRRSPGEQALALEAALLVLGYRLLLRFLPFKMFKGFLGRPGRAGFQKNLDTETLGQVSFWIGKTAPHLPLSCRCLPRALAARLMLKRRGIRSTLFLGLAKEDGVLRAHAWLMAGEIPVTGGADNSGLARMGCFH